ncbi:MAG: hypothetical protein ACI9U2_002425 [Bradymonadia bacterium]|jgi:hypothetical protein
MEWLQGKGKTSTDSGAAARTPLAPGLDPTGAAARGQSAELLDPDIKAGYVGGVAGMKVPDQARRVEDEQRATAEIHAALRKAGVPPPQVVFTPLQTHGVFRRRTWTLLINSTRFHQPDLRLRLLGTVYHEARHAEQFFDALRVAAALRSTRTAAQLVRWITSVGETPPPVQIIELARQRAPRGSEGHKWFALYFGVGAKLYRDTQFDRKIAKRRVNDLRQEKANLLERVEMGSPIAKGVRDDFNARMRAAKAAYVKADEGYRALLDEEDAHDLGDRVVDMIRSAS